MIGSRSSGGIASVRLKTGGSGYTAPPTITLSGGGGTGAAVAAYMAGTRVRSLEVTNPGSGYTSDPVLTISGNAEATAHAHTAGFRPMKFLRSRQGLMVGVDGMGRGIRWDGKSSSVSPLGLLPPQHSPSVTTSSATSKYLAAIEIFEPGSGYSSPPAVTISGGTPTTPAKARAFVSNGRVASIEVTERGSGYQGVPTISIAGGNPSSPTLTVNVSGRLNTIEVTNSGSGYTTTPSVTFAQTNGLTGANAYAVTDGDKVTGIFITAAGTGATATPTISIQGTATAKANVRYSVSSVTVVSGGQNYYSSAAVAFSPAPADVSATPAAATASVAGGAIQSINMISGGLYETPPTATVEGLESKATARMSNNLLGKYACATRYLAEDDEGRTVPSSISDIEIVDTEQGASALNWTLSHGHIDDRVTAVELWRSTGDQEILLYRVATIPVGSFPGTYTDTLSDPELIDTDRDEYGLLPVTMPSGQINARRFGVLPGNYAVGVMFQDRAWYAVDTTGQFPNSLMFSEVDEPESVPAVNQLILQESVGDSDEIVTLVPLASMLLVFQRRHIYKLQYVAQPVIDASILLSAYRGILNPDCCDVMGGVAFAADSHGMYAFDGSSLDPISVPVENYWREQIIDFTKAQKFFVKCDDSEMVARFFFCDSSSSNPDRALCYSVVTKAWWLEEYGLSVRSAGNKLDGFRHITVYGTEDGDLASPGGYTDDGSPIGYSVKTGNFPLSGGPSRSVGVLYTPTASTADMRLELYYNGSQSPRQNAVQVDRGGPFTADAAGGLLDMRVAQSHLADSVGYAKAHFSGRGSDMSSGADRHVAVSLSGTQSSSSNVPVIHAITVEGIN